MTRVAIYGAGAIGGYIGALLHRAGADVTLIARGPHLAAIRDHGLRLDLADETLVVHPPATDDPAQAGEQDYVFVTVKAHAAPALAGPMQPMLGPETAVVTAMNGIPWWYFHGLDGPLLDRRRPLLDHRSPLLDRRSPLLDRRRPLRDHRMPLLDPGDAQWRGIGPERVIGCVAWQSAAVVAPGHIAHLHGDRLALGEPLGRERDQTRVRRLAALLREAGIRARVARDIRTEIWLKLWGNLSFNPVSVLTGLTLEGIARDPDARSVVAAMMEEGRAVATALGVRLRMSLDERIAVAERVGPHRTSMLQDLESGRPMEIDALVGVVAELGRITGVPTPTIDHVRALVVARARAAGCYPPA